MPKNAKDAKNAKNANCFRSANAISSTTKAYSISMAEAKKGRRRWSPPGGYNPPPTEGGAGRARPQTNRPQLNVKLNHRWRI